MRIIVVGAGALGSLMGGRFALAGRDVTFLEIDGEIVKTINAKGLTIIERDGKENIVSSVRAVRNPEEIGHSPDLVLIAVKSYATEGAVNSALGIPSIEKACFLSVQNGLGNLDVISRYVDKSRILIGTTAQGATLEAPGRVRHGGSGPTYIGTPTSGDAEMVKRVLDVFNDAGMEAHYREDIERLIWEKLLVNVGINAITALTGILNAGIASIPHAEAVSRKAVKEAIKVANALGITIPQNFDDRVLEVARATGANRSSMGQDIDVGRPTEIDAINGAIVRLGKQLNIPTPVNWTLTELVKTIERTRSMNNE